jgi:Ca-activated chloride channel family protein
MNFDDFSFAQPWWLLLLAALPVLAWLQGGRGPMPAVRFSSVEAMRFGAQKRNAGWGGFARVLLHVALALLVIALARPRLGKTHDTIESSGVDIMLALDVSGSMVAEDFTLGGEPASRLDAVKDVTKRFIEARPNDRLGIIVFAGRPYLMSPATLDHTWLLQNLERMQNGILADTGTSIGTALASASNRLRDKVSKSKIIVLLTDGAENVTTVKPEIAAEAAKALGIKIYTIGVGTNGPVRVPVTTLFGQKQYRMQQFPTDEPGLQKIAQIGGGQFFRAADSETLNNVFKQIDQLEKTEVKLKRKVEWRELFEWFIAAGSLLLAVRAALAQTIWRTVP